MMGPSSTFKNKRDEYSPIRKIIKFQEIKVNQ